MNNTGGILHQFNIFLIYNLRYDRISIGNVEKESSCY